MQCVEDGADERHRVAEPHRQAAVEADEANAHDAKNRSYDVVAVRPSAHERPCQERDDHAIRTSQKCVFARRSVGDANGLRVVCKEHGQAE